MAAKTIDTNETRGDLSAYFTRGIAKRPTQNKQYPPRDAKTLSHLSWDGYRHT